MRVELDVRHIGAASPPRSAVEERDGVDVAPAVEERDGVDVADAELLLLACTVARY